MGSAGPPRPPARTSAALLSLVQPLPTMSELRATLSAAPPPAPSNAPASPRSKRPSKKRARPAFDARPAADAPAGGAPADTLFFPSLPPGMDNDAALRVRLPAPARELKFSRPAHGKPGKTLGWATFFSEADCAAALSALRRDAPELRSRLHTPRAGVPERKSGGVGHPAPEEAFRIRAEKVVAEGGLANTVLLRALPSDVSLPEMEEVLACLDDCCKALRVRSSETKGGMSRNFWLTYATRDAACSAFVAMSGAPVAFRCGRTQRLCPLVHNDATDAESKVRRAREMALGSQSAVGNVREGHAAFAAGEHVADELGLNDMDGLVYRDESVSNLALLEQHLREQPGRLYFLSEDC